MKTFLVAWKSDPVNFERIWGCVLLSDIEGVATGPTCNKIVSLERGAVIVLPIQPATPPAIIVHSLCDMKLEMLFEMDPVSGLISCAAIKNDAKSYSDLKNLSLSTQPQRTIQRWEWWRAAWDFECRRVWEEKRQKSKSKSKWKFENIARAGSFPRAPGSDPPRRGDTPEIDVGGLEYCIDPRWEYRETHARTVAAFWKPLVWNCRSSIAWYLL